MDLSDNAGCAFWMQVARALQRTKKWEDQIARSGWILAALLCTQTHLVCAQTTSPLCRLSEEMRASLRGKTLTDAIRDKVLAESGAARIRILKPGQATTMEYRDDRVNIQVDGQDVIVSLR